MNVDGAVPLDDSVFWTGPRNRAVVVDEMAATVHQAADWLNSRPPPNPFRPGVKIFCGHIWRRAQRPTAICRHLSYLTAEYLAMDLLRGIATTLDYVIKVYRTQPGERQVMKPVLTFPYPPFSGSAR